MLNTFKNHFARKLIASVLPNVFNSKSISEALLNFIGFHDGGSCYTIASHSPKTLWKVFLNINHEHIFDFIVTIVTISTHYSLRLDEWEKKKDKKRTWTIFASNIFIHWLEWWAVKCITRLLKIRPIDVGQWMPTYTHNLYII